MDLADLVNEAAINAIGNDRPGIVAAVTEALARLDANLEDTSMTNLRGHFAMLLIVGSDRLPAEVEAALFAVAERLDLTISVRAVSTDPAPALTGAHHVVTVHGADRNGTTARRRYAISDAVLPDLPASGSAVGRLEASGVMREMTDRLTPSGPTAPSGAPPTATRPGTGASSAAGPFRRTSRTRARQPADRVHRPRHLRVGLLPAGVGGKVRTSAR